jgi:hypothetical protein
MRMCVIMDLFLLGAELNTFNRTLATESNIRKFIELLTRIASNFTFVEEDTSLNGVFTIILSLSEQYKRELVQKNVQS